MPSLTKLEKIIRRPLSPELLAAAHQENMAKPDCELGKSLKGYFYNDIDRAGMRFFDLLWCDDLEADKANAIAAGLHNPDENFSNLVLVLARLFLLTANANGNVEEAPEGPLHRILLDVIDIQKRMESGEISVQYGEKQARDLVTSKDIYNLVLSDDKGGFIDRLIVGLRKKIDQVDRKSLRRRKPRYKAE